MRLIELWEILKKIAPEELAYPGDENGIIFGEKDWEVNKIGVAVEATIDVIERAIKENVDALIVHEHPFPKFEEVAKTYKAPSIFTDRVILTKLKLLAENRIGVIRVHTNWDDAEGGNNDRIARSLGKIIRKYKYARLVEMEDIDVISLAKRIKTMLRSDYVYIYGPTDKIVRKVFVVSGAGGKMTIVKLASEVADCLVTADVTKNTIVYAEQLGFPIIDPGHLAMENFGMYGLYEKLKKEGMNVLFFERIERRCVI